MWTPAERNENGRLLRAALQRQDQADERWHEYKATVKAAWNQAKENLPEEALDAYFDEFIRPTLEAAEKRGKSPRTVRFLKQEIRDPDAVAALKDKKNAKAKWQRAAAAQTPDPPNKTERDVEGTREKERLKKAAQRAANADPLKPRRKALTEFIKTATEHQLEALERAMRDYP